MAHAWLQAEENSGQWELELTMLDHLIWSTQAKVNADGELLLRSPMGSIHPRSRNTVMENVQHFVKAYFC